MTKDVGVIWDVPYSKTLDTVKGAWSKWFVDGKTNIYKSSVEKFVKLNPQKIAYHFMSEDGKTSSIPYSELDEKVSKMSLDIALLFSCPFLCKILHFLVILNSMKHHITLIHFVSE